jgi:hypothetical protein
LISRGDDNSYWNFPDHRQPAPCLTWLACLFQCLHFFFLAKAESATASAFFFSPLNIAEEVQLDSFRMFGDNSSFLGNHDNGTVYLRMNALESNHKLPSMFVYEWIAEENDRETYKNVCFVWNQCLSLLSYMEEFSTCCRCLTYYIYHTLIVGSFENIWKLVQCEGIYVYGRTLK